MDSKALGLLGSRVRFSPQPREDWQSFLYDYALVSAYTERGGLVCDWGDKRFRIGAGMTKEVRANPPKIGARIRFSYRGTNWRGYPRAPAFVEVTESASQLSAPTSPSSESSR